MADELSAEDVIALFQLLPHPEGGHYRETFRDVEGHAGRAHSTAILFLLKAGEVSRWHRVDAAEFWHWHGGAPLLLRVKQGEAREEYRLGPNWRGGEIPQALVPPNAWQSAESLATGRWSAVRWRRASTLPASSSPLRASSSNPYAGRH
jgi:uncharacterized protein